MNRVGIGYDVHCFEEGRPLILGGVEIMVVALLPSTYRDLVVFSLLLALIVWRPYGILGKPRVQKV